VRRYLLDTSPLSAYLFGRPPAVALIEPWLARFEVATSILVYGEVIEYLMGRPGFAEGRDQFRQLLHAITPIFLSYSVLDRYAKLRRDLRPPFGAGAIGDIDALIAATALERELTVVTTDTDYTRVPGLSVMLLDRRTLTSVEDVTG
jgi:predicted nucleic acid-binding protein